MAKIRPILTKAFYLAALLAIFLTGCVSQKKIKYLQQAEGQDSVFLWKLAQAVEYRIQPNDNLYVTIKSLSEKANEIFNNQTETAGTTGDASIYLTSYSVSPDGYIEFPLIGKLFIRDMTLNEVQLKLQERVDEYLKEAVVIVKLVNFNITLLGELQKPGEYKVYQDKITIFEGIAMAGDFTDFANRKQVALLRVSEKGTELHYLDLNSANILSSPYYYLKPNDVIYAAPLPVKQWGGSTFPYAIVFSAISTIALIITLIATL